MLSPALAETPSRLVIQAIDPLRQEGWNTLLRSHPGANFFHTVEWARVLHFSYGHQPVHLSVIHDGRLHGLLALVEVSSPLTGRRGVSLAFTDACPPLISSEATAPVLLEEALAYGRTRKWKYFEARDWPCAQTSATPSLSFCGHVLNLERGEKALYDGLEGPVRTAVRKAEKSGVKVEILRSEEAMATYYRLHRLTRHRHGLPPQPYAFFQNIQQAVVAKDMGFVAVANHEGQPVSAAVFLHFAGKAIYKFGASDKRYQKVRPNSFMMWEVIKHLAQNGFVSLDFGRSSLGEEGLCRFKRSFGAMERKLDYIRYDFSKQAFVQDTDKAAGWHNHLFRCLPLPAARLAGAILYPHLS